MKQNVVGLSSCSARYQNKTKARHDEQVIRALNCNYLSLVSDLLSYIPTTMTSSKHSEYNSDRLRSEILILSAYFSNQQSRSSESHRDEYDWPLCSDISTLLTLGNDSSPEARLVNAVAGKINNHAIEHLICVENAFQHYGLVQVLKSDLKHSRSGKIDDRVDRAWRNPFVRNESKAVCTD